MMKISKFRHATTTVPKREQSYSDLKPSGAMWDMSNMISANATVFALPIHTMAGGRVVVHAHANVGKISSTEPTLGSHTAPVIDVQFNPFSPSILATGSEDASVKIWRVPEEGLTENINDPLSTLSGHSKKVGILAFHPSAENVLLTASGDNTIKLWDIEEAKEYVTLDTQHKDLIQSVNFNLTGTLINTTCKDKKARILDVRSGQVVSEVAAHTGLKATRSIWAKRLDRIITVGFNRDQYRQMMLWDPRNFTEPILVHEVDRLTSVFMPLYDEDTALLYLAGKGDTSIHLFEFSSSAPHCIPSCSFSCGQEPQRGLCLLPRSLLNPRECEIGRMLRVTATSTQPMSLALPRKLASTVYQEDIYPPSFADVPALKAKDFLRDGKSAAPLEKSMKFLFDKTVDSGATLTHSTSTGGVLEMSNKAASSSNLTKANSAAHVVEAAVKDESETTTATTPVAATTTAPTSLINSEKKKLKAEEAKEKAKKLEEAAKNLEEAAKKLLAEEAELKESEEEALQEDVRSAESTVVSAKEKLMEAEKVLSAAMEKLKKFQAAAE